MTKRFKVTRIEIWEVATELDGGEISIHSLHDAIQDDILNSQDNPRFTDDDNYEVTPKEIVEFKVEEIE